MEGPVRLLGLRSDVPDLMQAADGFLMTSRWEGLPMVLLEAGASGLPVVATDVGGSRDAVLDGVSGYLTPAADPGALGAGDRQGDRPADRRLAMRWAPRGERISRRPSRSGRGGHLGAAVPGPGDAASPSSADDRVAASSGRSGHSAGASPRPARPPPRSP